MSWSSSATRDDIADLSPFLTDTSEPSSVLNCLVFLFTVSCERRQRICSMPLVALNLILTCARTSFSLHSCKLLSRCWRCRAGLTYLGIVDERSTFAVRWHVSRSGILETLNDRLGMCSVENLNFCEAATHCFTRAI